jgi:hypothetical protein
MSTARAHNNVCNYVGMLTCKILELTSYSCQMLKQNLPAVIVSRHERATPATALIKQFDTLDGGCNFVIQDEIQAAEGERYITLMQLYIPVYMQLVSILLTKVQIPPESVYNSWTAGNFLSA